MTAFEPRPLHLHSLDSLVADLISGRPVLVGEDRAYVLADERTRSALEWYRQRGHGNWSANVTSANGEDLVTAILKPPPALPALPARPANANGRRLSLKKVEAHRFAGVHKFGTPQAAPDNFVHEFSAPLTLFEGRNGSGKTSLLNAIIWALTGKLLRPQRDPEVAEMEFDCWVDPLNSAEDPTVHKISPVTPTPDVASYRPDQTVIPADTWVELTFIDEAGNTLPAIRRSHTRNSRDTLVETPPDLTTLGVDPIAIRIGTVMPGLLPLIKVGKESELGLAVAQLTGLSALIDLSGHATRAKNKISGDFAKTATNTKDGADASYNLAKADLERGLSAHPGIAPSASVPTPSDDPSIEQVIDQITEQFEATKAAAFESARSILGNTFDPTDSSLSSDLERNIDRAIELTARPQNLESLNRLRKLGSVSPDDLKTTSAKIQQIVDEAKILEGLAKDPSSAARDRLYARVAIWIADHPDPRRNEDLCAVCGGSLAEAVDPVSGRLVKVHLHEAKNNASLLSQTLERWAENALGDLLRSVAENLRAELSVKLPEHPCDLLRTGIVDELFDQVPFMGVLATLQSETANAFDVVVSGRADLAPADDVSLPTECKSLEQALQRLDLAIRFAQWRHDNDALARNIFATILGRRPKDAEASESLTLTGKLLDLEKTVRGAKPISDALLQCGRLKDQLSVRRGAEKRLSNYSIASSALANLAMLGDLATQQVGQLQNTLRDAASKWRDRIYLGAFPDTARELAGTSLGRKGELDILVRTGGISAPAQHVINASALRANLVAFFFAFWEQVLNERGGLRTLLLDDPQELLDDENRERLATAMAHLVNAGAEPIIASYDSRFAGCVSRLVGVRVEHFAVHPATKQQSVLRLRPPLKVLADCKLLFDKDRNAEEPARDYADSCRVFLEAMLGDLFDEPAHSAWALANPHPTLAGFVARLRPLVRENRQGMFSGNSFKRFVEHSALIDNSAVLQLMNKAHHGRRDEIRAADVAVCVDALDELTQLAEQMYGEAYRWRRRDAANTNDPPAMTPTPILPMVPPTLSVVVCPDLAAFTRYAPVGESQQTPELLNPNALDGKAVFYLRRNNFGFAAPEGSLAIVEADPRPVADRRLVVARHGSRIYARRFLKAADNASIGLTAEGPDPRKRNPQTVFLPETQVEVHQVVGVIFDHDIAIGVGSDEAVQVDATRTFQRIEIAFRVVGESAVPLALEKQIVLGGSYIDVANLGQKKGSLVALTLDDGASIFKRVGESLGGELAHLRQFESIGGLGSSEVLAVVKKHPGVRSVQHARLIIGVLYHG